MTNKYGLNDIEATEEEISSDIGLIFGGWKHTTENKHKKINNIERNIIIGLLTLVIIYLIIVFMLFYTRQI